MKNLKKSGFIATLAIILLSIPGSTRAQDKFFTRDGHIKFFSSTPMEDIAADNYKVTAVMDMADGKIEFAALIKAFEFKKALMEEHFNENYLESDKYPKSIFKGTIKDFSKIDLSKDGKHKVEVIGDMTMHGVTKPIRVTGNIERKGEEILVYSLFKVKPEDYNIEIPGAVRDKIAQEIEITVDVKLAKFSK